MLYFDKKIVKMAEMLENKGFHRTQSKNVTELIIEVILLRWWIIYYQFSYVHIEVVT